jgi:hypothetical protein
MNKSDTLCWHIVRKRTNTMGYWTYIKAWCGIKAELGKQSCYKHRKEEETR